MKVGFDVVEEANKSQLPPGTNLAHYEVRGLIGEGAMGTVYRAHDTSLDRTVAIKVLRPEIADEGQTIQRFNREARAAARVNHPNLTHIYFVGPEEDLHYFAMEYVPGPTLSEHLEKHGPLDVDDAIDILVQAAKGLQAAHEAEVIHRDVKPSNMKLAPGGVVKITDFGLSKRLSGELDMTGEGRILGTPRYMSPEQCRGETMDHRTDIYSLGLVGWFLLTGKPPYDADSIGKLLDEQMNRPLPSLLGEDPDMSPIVQAALERMCAKRPEDRPSDMAEVIKLLEDARPRPIEPAPIAIRTSAAAVDVLFMMFVLGISTTAVFWGSGGKELNPQFLWIIPFVAGVYLVLSQLGMEIWKGTSPAKFAFNLRVVRHDGLKAARSALAARFLLRFPLAVNMLIPTTSPDLDQLFLILQVTAMVAAVLCFFIFKRRTLSDLVTRTRVIYQGSGRLILPFRRRGA